MEDIPNSFKHWLKDNGHYTEFKRLINVCGYKVSDFYLLMNDGDSQLKKWFSSRIDSKHVEVKSSTNKKRMMLYSDFLDSQGLNWRNK